VPTTNRIAKERGGFGGGFEDDSKFDNPWRRDGPLPDLPNARDSSRRRFDGPPPDRHLPSVSEGSGDWRSSRPPRQSEEAPPFKRKGSGFQPPDAQTGAADKEEVWTIGGKFKPAAPGPDETPGSKFGSLRGKGDMNPPKDTDEGDWRAVRPKPAPSSVSRKFPRLYLYSSTS
jgi:translation initiation factor 4B